MISLRSGRQFVADRNDEVQIMTTQSDQPETRYIPIPKWNDYHDWPPPGGLRHLRFHAETNGFHSAFKQVGRRVLVDEVEFFRCLERRNQGAA
jgi:hypothetical protein